MLEKALKGSPGYWIWLLVLGGIASIGMLAYVVQLNMGLTVTGMSRDVSWGFYIAQLTYLVGVAASAVMLVLPAYFHHYKAFKKIIILGEFLAIASVAMCILFVTVDLGQPQRLFNVVLHPTPNSVLFWDMVVLNVYMFLNLFIGWVTLESERNRVAPPHWLKYFIYLSIIWAFSIHTVTAFLYAGLPGRHYWLTAIMAARFLASAFASGPAILLLLVFLLQKITEFRAGDKAINTVATIITYAMCVNIFFYLLEIFTAYYSGIPGHQHPITYLFSGLHGFDQWVPYMWVAVAGAALSLVLLIPAKIRYNHTVLPYALGLLVLATYIDKGIGLIVGGFTPTPFETVTEYVPTIPELMITVGVYAIGALILTVLWKVALEVKRDLGTIGEKPEDVEKLYVSKL
ncbi:menaquinol oxidoreductase [Oceanidesulfovibrio indonesiensis]|uniref:Menaquinol oxidoreductase n=1 Tax=Oceanidesulfovibrio indonesiensis TaxID=54767 RepID=A0A7M3MDN8_9BACT|nr:NrfD/PsrC family molybdoenzyme membrane anchor subunit [Oceanidesulfovibrio indonesiensis]TVM16826.1 menaquinol oxidoreductase [Oceanidesulfovibrio indonesiensis]